MDAGTEGRGVMAEEPVDYKEILRKYMNLVVVKEGTAFLGWLMPGEEFTAEELRALKEIEATICAA